MADAQTIQDNVLLSQSQPVDDTISNDIPQNMEDLSMDNNQIQIDEIGIDQENQSNKNIQISPDQTTEITQNISDQSRVIDLDLSLNNTSILNNTVDNSNNDLSLVNTSIIGNTIDTSKKDLNSTFSSSSDSLSTLLKTSQECQDFLSQHSSDEEKEQYKDASDSIPMSKDQLDLMDMQNNIKSMFKSILILKHSKDKIDQINIIQSLERKIYTQLELQDSLINAHNQCKHQINIKDREIEELKIALTTNKLNQEELFNRNKEIENLQIIIQDLQSNKNITDKTDQLNKNTDPEDEILSIHEIPESITDQEGNKSPILNSIEQDHSQDLFPDTVPKILQTNEILYNDNLKEIKKTQQNIQKKINKIKSSQNDLSDNTITKLENKNNLPNS